MGQLPHPSRRALGGHGHGVMAPCWCIADRGHYPAVPPGLGQVLSCPKGCPGPWDLPGSWLLKIP